MTRVYIFNDYGEHGPENIRVTTSSDGARALYERIVGEARAKAAPPDETEIDPWEKSRRERVLAHFENAVVVERAELARRLALLEPSTGDLARELGWGGTQLHIVEME